MLPAPITNGEESEEILVFTAKLHYISVLCLRENILVALYWIRISKKLLMLSYLSRDSILLQRFLAPKFYFLLFLMKAKTFTSKEACRYQLHPVKHWVQNIWLQPGPRQEKCLIADYYDRERGRAYHQVSTQVYITSFSD